MAGRKRSSGLLILSGEELLLLRRSRRSNNPRTWGLPGGQRERAEAAYTAARRESNEEMRGVPPHVLLGRLTVRRGPKRYDVFVCRSSSRLREIWSPRLNGEHTRHKWVDLDWCRRNQRGLHPVLRALVGHKPTRRWLAHALYGAALSAARVKTGRVDLRAQPLWMIEPTQREAA